MKAFWVKCSTATPKGWVVPFYVVGDVEAVIGALISEGETLDDLSREDFQVEEDKVYLDPGGMLLMEDCKEFTLRDVKFTIRPHKLLWVMDLLREAKERVPGYLRIPQGPGSTPWFLYLSSEMRDLLLQQLMSMEFEPGVKESRDRAQEAHDKAFLDGKLAWPAGSGGFLVVREPTDEEAAEIEKQLGDEERGFDVPEGIEPF